jgi:hypothetical protein
MNRAPIRNRARWALVAALCATGCCPCLAALCATGCALPARTGRDESERIDAITLGQADLAEERAFVGLPPLAAPPNRTRSILESSPSYEIRPELRRASAVRSSNRSRKSSAR